MATEAGNRGSFICRLHLLVLPFAVSMFSPSKFFQQYLKGKRGLLWQQLVLVFKEKKKLLCANTTNYHKNSGRVGPFVHCHFLELQLKIARLYCKLTSSEFLHASLLAAMTHQGFFLLFFLKLISEGNCSDSCFWKSESCSVLLIFAFDPAALEGRSMKDTYLKCFQWKKYLWCASLVENCSNSSEVEGFFECDPTMWF